MKIKGITLKSKKIINLVGFFLITIANVSAFDKLKYIGLILILSTIYIEVLRNGIEKKHSVWISILFSIFIYEILFQNLSNFQVINAIFYYVTLLTISILGKNILKSGEDFLYCTIGIFVANIIGFLYSPSLLIQQFTENSSRFRIYGSFSHPNALASTINICLISWIIYLSTIKNITKKEKIVTITLIIILMFQLILTNSRGYIFLSIFMIVCYISKGYARENTKKNKIRRILILYFFIITILLIIYYFIKTYAIKDASYLYRLSGVKNLKLKGLRYLFGYGMVSSNEIDYSILDNGSMEIAWLKMFYKVGIIGVICFIILVIKIFIDGIKIKDKKIKYAFYATYFSFLIGSFVESNLVTIFNANPIFMWLCLSAIPYLEQRREYI